jgi:hypothetical protein
LDTANNIVILIHGTWPRKQRGADSKHRAAWCEETSLCRKEVRAAFCESADIRVFEWAGANSPDARLAAADQLNHFIAELRRQRPRARVYVVAHSHAGNVVLYAEQRATEPSGINGAVFLSAPFLLVAPRVLGPRLAQKLELTASLAFMFLILVIYAVVWPASATKAYSLFHSATWKGFWLTFVPIGLVGGLLARFGLIPRLRALHRWSHLYARSLRLPSELPYPVLIIRGAGDEATGALGATQLISHLATRVLRAGFRLVPEDAEHKHTKPAHWRVRWQWLPRFVKAGLLICVVGCIAMGMLVIARALGVHPSTGITHLAGAVTLLLLSIGVLVMAWEAMSQLLVIPPFLLLSGIAAFSAIPFGLRFVMATFGLDVSAEPTPPGRWTCFQLEPNGDPYECRRGLSHGTHSNPAALKEMSRWFRELNDR